jgi:hypothetical protein
MQKTLVFDDMDGETIATTTIRFSIDDDFLEIDLSDGHADEFTKAMAPFVAAARTYSPATSARKPGMSKDERAAIVEWAATQGIEIAPRGRIASDIVEKFKAAQDAEDHATVEQIEKAIEAGEKSTETAPVEKPETPAGEPTSTGRGRRRS